MLNVLNELVKNYGTRISKEELANKIELMVCRDHQTAILNEKYLIVDGKNYQFIKTKNGWKVKQF